MDAVLETKRAVPLDASLLSLLARASEVLSAHHVEHAMLFGSHAKGTADERSDIDIAFWPGANFSAVDFFAIEDDLEELPTLRRWDLVDMSCAARNSLLVEEVAEHGVVLL